MEKGKTPLKTADGEEGYATLSSEYDMAIVTYDSSDSLYKSGPVNIQTCMRGIGSDSWVPTSPWGIVLSW